MNTQVTHNQQILKLDKVDYNYSKEGGELLRNINLPIKEGEAIAIIGPSGCGKSTLLKLIAGLLQPTSGNINGTENLELGLSPQSPTLFPWLNVTENITFKKKLGNKHTTEAEAHELLECLDVLDKAYEKPSKLSGGQQSRVAIARALTGAPNLLLLDEPFSQLDEVTAEAIILKLSTIIHKRRLATIFISHNISQAVLLADKILVLGGSPVEIRGMVDITLPKPRTTTSLQSKDATNAITQLHKLLKKVTQ